MAWYRNIHTGQVIEAPKRDKSGYAEAPNWERLPDPPKPSKAKAAKPTTDKTPSAKEK